MTTYKDCGVNIEAADGLVERIARRTKSTYTPNVLAGVGGFASLVKVPPGMKEPVLVSGTDGVGTKLKIAFEVGRHDTVGIDLVAMCINDVITCGARPLFFLDYFACGKLDTTVAEAVVSGIIEGCKQAGCSLVGGETAEMPGMYAEGEYDLAGFAVGIVDREEIIDGRRVAVGDAVLGFPSTGLHANGYSLVRKLLLEKLRMPLTSRPTGLDCTLAEELLKPTKIYTKEVFALIETCEVRSFAHITGGGLLLNPPRTLPEGLGMALYEGSWRVPSIFRLIEECGVSHQEMLRTFNMGIGMTAVVRREAAEYCISFMQKEGLACLLIGEVEERGASPWAVRIV